MSHDLKTSTYSTQGTKGSTWPIAKTSSLGCRTCAYFVICNKEAERTLLHSQLQMWLSNQMFKFVDFDSRKSSMINLIKSILSGDCAMVVYLLYYR